ncbi:nucleotide exchange factor GrpE [Candidatus Saccharibacteria bacterium]|nr:nucleotide exchange factor GrpE [Candidatus Saccharibacteria bacterium]
MNKPKRETKQELLERIGLLTEALQRERADAENGRRRAALDREQASAAARTTVVTDLLPLLDNLERAFGSVPAQLEADNWVKGVLYIRQQLQTYLQALDLIPVPAAGQQFDPATMEAVETVTDKSQPSGLVAAEIVKGYLYQGQILRPAQVKVVKND